jgi:hypothetical protein
MKELYVYYRISCAHLALARSEIDGAFEVLRRLHPRLQARLLRRLEPQAEHETWMEIYTHPGGLSADQHALIEALTQELPRRRSGPRHQELFELLRG